MTVTPIEKTEISTKLHRVAAINAGAVFRCNFGQDEEERAWTMMKNVSATWKLANISTVDCSVDTLVTDVFLANGDSLIIRKDDDSLVAVVAVGVTGSGPYIMDTSSVTGGEVPVHVFKDDCVLKYDGIVAQKVLGDVMVSSRRNLFENPYFTYDVVGWETDNSSPMRVRWDAGRIFFYPPYYKDRYTYSYPRIPLVIGRRYRIYHYNVSGKYSGYISFRYHSGIEILRSNGTVEFTATESAAYLFVYSGEYARVDSIELTEISVSINRHYADYNLYPATRNIEVTLDIPVKGSELTSLSSNMYEAKE